MDINDRAPDFSLPDENGKNVSLKNFRGKSVVLIDTASAKMTTSFEVGDRPWGIALSPDEKLLFSANGPSGDVSIVDLNTKSVLKKVKVGDRPWGVTVVTQ